MSAAAQPFEGSSGASGSVRAHRPVRVGSLLCLASVPLLLAALACGGGGSGSSRYPADSSVITAGRQMVNDAGWYADAVIYQVWVKAFADGVYADGIGDLPGVQGKLDYLQSLGVNTLWLSPIFACADMGSNMHGYDTTDYYAINPSFGQKADLANLISAIHAKGMRVIFDFVPNHTSPEHAWFSAHPSWYVWQSSLPSGWGYPWGGGSSASVWLSSSGAYFYSAFGTSTMADLNYYNPEVVTAMHAVQSYWLDQGFDGLRLDAARYLCEEGPGAAADQADTHVRLQGFRSVIDEYATPGNSHPHPNDDPTLLSTKMMVAEAWTSDASGITPYYGNGSDEFNMCLDFSAPWAIYNSIHQADATQLTGLWEYEQAHYPAGYRTATFDSNHDNVISRPGSQYAGNARQIVLAEALNLLAPGTPIIYYGNEVGMTGVSGSDINLRQDMDWSAVAAQSPDPESILSWCKYLLQARAAYPALRGGYATLATDLGTGEALAYMRSSGSERLFIVANLTGSTRTITVSNLTGLGVAADATVSPVLGAGATGQNLTGGGFTASAIPAYGIRVYHAAGGTFQGTIHGDMD